MQTSTGQQYLFKSKHFGQKQYPCQTPALTVDQNLSIQLTTSKFHNSVVQKGKDIRIHQFNILLR